MSWKRKALEETALQPKTSVATRLERQGGQETQQSLDAFMQNDVALKHKFSGSIQGASLEKGEQQNRDHSSRAVYFLRKSYYDCV